ncbi:MFS transporter [Sphingomonas sp. PAMC 26605]|uniref:MFS transporter n=1 Tax=Sphingomonas sp. PAMC 26605 TaxID=1112214 RepID=UPI00026CCFD4|nr:MFS transporter [Sphingomonas sp. PAMC 26605]
MMQARAGAAVAAALVGTLIGALGAGAPDDRYGSRAVLIWIVFAYMVSAVGSAASDGLAMLIAFRFVGGLAIGGLSVLAPVGIAAVSPPERRGRMVGLFQLSVVAAILTAYVSNFTVARMFDGDAAWRLKLAIAALPAIVFFVKLLRIPDGRRWLAQKGRAAEARRAIGDPDRLLAEFATRTSDPARLQWRVDRRPILLAIGRGETLLLPALIVCILFFAISQGAVIWVSLSEIFPTAVCAWGQVIGSATHCGMNALLAFAFPIVAHYTQALPFWLFAAAMVVQFFVTWRYFPEARGVPLEQLEALIEMK